MLELNENTLSLGQFNKIICDAIGLWAGESKDIVFNVPASEKERRKALSEAFGSVQSKNGSWRLDELLSETSKIAPKDKKEVKKNKTLKAYTNHFGKEDFFSYDEFTEYKEYIELLINEKFPGRSVSGFAREFYTSSMMYYREFIREDVSCLFFQPQAQGHFKNKILRKLIDSLVRKRTMSADKFYSVIEGNEWHLRSFIDSMVSMSGISLHKLHQFHEIRLNNRFSDQEIWKMDFSSTPVNTKSKQVVDRLRKNNKVKWDSFFEIIRPCACLLTDYVDEEEFAVLAFSAFVAHNLDVFGFNEDPSGSVSEYPKSCHPDFMLPVSDKIDLLISFEKSIDDNSLMKLISEYRNYLEELKNLVRSPQIDFDVPSVLDFVYGKNDDFQIEMFSNKIKDKPFWISEWCLARTAMFSGDGAQALKHFKRSLVMARYRSGPLFMPLYIEICAFCKYQFRQLRSKGEEDIFDRFYNSLGSDATRYAALLGYASGSSRDANTLIPRLIAPVKESAILHRIDRMAESLKFNLTFI